MTQTPIQEPVDTSVLAGAIATVLRAELMEFEDMLPARLVSYDDKTNRAVVRPLVMLGLTDGRKVRRASVANIPVFRLGGGGFFIRFPVKPGDFGWIKANDRDISLIFQSEGQEDWPNTERLHSFSDALFIPDTWKDWVINGGNADALVIQSMDGSVCLALHEGKYELTAPEGIHNVPETTFNGNVTIIGNQSVKGDSTSEGTMRHDGLFELDGVSVNDHDHGGVQPGSSRTNPFGS